MGKTPLQKEIAIKEGMKESSLRPPKDNFLHPKHRTQLKILWGCKRFSEDVSNLLSGRNVLQSQKAIMNKMPDEVHVKLNVLGSLMLNWVVINVSSTLIVTPKKGGTIRRKSKLFHQMSKPQNLLTS